MNEACRSFEKHSQTIVMAILRKGSGTYGILVFRRSTFEHLGVRWGEDSRRHCLCTLPQELMYFCDLFCLCLGIKGFVYMGSSFI